VTPGRVRLGDLMEPEPEFNVSPSNPRTPGGGFASVAMSVRNHSSDQSGTDIILEGRLGWTQPSDTQKVELAAGQTQQVEHKLDAGDHVKWSVGVAAYDIHIHARFVQKKNSGDTVALVFNSKRLGDPYDSHHGALISGVYQADAPGSLQIALDNSCAPAPLPPRPPQRRLRKLLTVNFVLVLRRVNRLLLCFSTCAGTTRTASACRTDSAIQTTTSRSTATVCFTPRTRRRKFASSDIYINSGT